VQVQVLKRRILDRRRVVYGGVLHKNIGTDVLSFERADKHLAFGVIRDIRRVNAGDSAAATDLACHDLQGASRASDQTYACFRGGQSKADRGTDPGPSAGNNGNFTLQVRHQVASHGSERCWRKYSLTHGRRPRRLRHSGKLPDTALGVVRYITKLGAMPRDTILRQPEGLHMRKTPSSSRFLEFWSAAEARPVLNLAFGLGVLGLIVVSLLPGQFVPVIMNDKLEHFVAYLTLAVVGSAVFRTTRGALLLFCFLCVLAVLLELGQEFSPGRTVDAADAAAGWAGACFALLPPLTQRLRLLR
jgi:VanZ family protein